MSYHVEFFGSNLSFERDPIIKAEELESIINQQEENGYDYIDTVVVKQARSTEYTFLIFKKDDSNPSTVKQRIRNKKY